MGKVSFLNDFSTHPVYLVILSEGRSPFLGGPSRGRVGHIPTWLGNGGGKGSSTHPAGKGRKGSQQFMVWGGGGTSTVLIGLREESTVQSLGERAWSTVLRRGGGW